MGRTLLDKIWDRHLVKAGQVVDGTPQPDLIYIDLHLVHEMTSPQAFEGLRTAGRPVRRPDLTVAVEDHTVPTRDISHVSEDPGVWAQLSALRTNCREAQVPLLRIGEAKQGIVHVIGPELGLSQPGMTIVCGDSHTSTHGALGALAFGIGTSEVEHVLATQTLSLRRFRSLSVTVTSRTGGLKPGLTGKDLALALIARIGMGGGQGFAIEFRGNVIEQLPMDGRLTLCNMSIEAGARAALIAPDEITFDYLGGRERAPVGSAWAEAKADWAALRSDDDAVFDKSVELDADELEPTVTWGTNPSQALPLSARVPDPALLPGEADRRSTEQALSYMGLEPGTRLRDIRVDTVFLGSCTNSRIGDLRAAAAVLRGRHVADGVRMIVVPGSMQIRAAAEREGLDGIFIAAGAEWRMAGCSMCIALGEDRIEPGERCASTSNRNFEGRQGPGARTHLVSPTVAAATAVRGTLSAPSDLDVG